MKSSAVLLLLLASLTVSVILQAAKNSKPDDVDRMAANLSAVRQLVPPGGTIAFHGEPGKTELLFWSRLALAPRFLDAVKPHDTTLIIRNINDTLPKPGQQVVWQHADTRYHYSLTIPR